MAASVLLVEDEENLASLVEAYLQKEGYGVVAVGTGAEALDVLAERARPPGRPRPQPSGHGRARRLPADPHALDRADRDADRARRAGRPTRRARRGRRRLHRQAVLAAGARRADEGRPAAVGAERRRRAARPRRRRRAPRRARGRRRRPAGRAAAEGVRPARLPDRRTAASLSRATCCSNGSGATTTPAERGRSTCTSLSCVASSAGRS